MAIRVLECVPIEPQLGEEIFGLIEVLHWQVHKKFLGCHFHLPENWNWIQRCQEKKLSYETFRLVLNELAEPSCYIAGAASTKPATIFRRPSGAITAKSVPPRYNGAPGIPPAAQLNLM